MWTLSRSPAFMMAWKAWSSLSSSSAFSERKSTVNFALAAIELMVVPPAMVPTLYVVFGWSGTDCA